MKKENWILYTVIPERLHLINKNSDPSIKVLKEHKPIFSCFFKKRNLSPILNKPEMQLSNFGKLRKFYAKGKNAFCC